MLREYAVDPDAISNWHSFHYVVDSCGIDHGRLISEYPDHWAKLVYKAAKKAHNKPIQLKSIEDRLAKIKKKVTKRNSTFDSKSDWLSNAELEDSKQPFAAILSHHNPRSSGNVLIIDSLEDDTEKWKVDRQKSVERKAEALASELDPIFRFGSEFIFVDPHFNPCEDRFAKPVVSFVNHITRACQGVIRVEYHLIAAADMKAFEGNLNYYLVPELPYGFQVKFVRWKDLPYSDKLSGGKRLHPRFVLSDNAGVLIEWGLDEGNEGDFADMLLLGTTLRDKHWKEYQRATSPFDFVDEIDIVGNKHY